MKNPYRYFVLFPINSGKQIELCKYAPLEPASLPRSNTFRLGYMDTGILLLF